MKLPRRQFLRLGAGGAALPASLLNEIHILRTGPAISERYPFGQSNTAGGKSKPRTQCLSARFFVARINFNRQSNEIIICGPKADGTYWVECRTADGRVHRAMLESRA